MRNRTYMNNLGDLLTDAQVRYVKHCAQLMNLDEVMLLSRPKLTAVLLDGAPAPTDRKQLEAIRLSCNRLRVYLDARELERRRMEGKGTEGVETATIEQLPELGACGICGAEPGAPCSSPATGGLMGYLIHTYGNRH